jgi:hypothetical protein
MFCLAAPRGEPSLHDAAPRVEVHTAPPRWWQASGRRSSAFCLTLDRCIDCVTEFKDERLTHTFSPASCRACRPVRKSLRLTSEIVLRFLPWCLWCPITAETLNLACLALRLRACFHEVEYCSALASLRAIAALLILLPLVIMTLTSEGDI